MSLLAAYIKTTRSTAEIARLAGLSVADIRPLDCALPGDDVELPPHVEAALAPVLGRRQTTPGKRHIPRDDPTIEQIAGVIGKHWAEEFTQPCCTECGADVGKTMRIEGIDHVEGTDIGASFMCLDCLQEAVKRLQESKP